MTALAHLSRRRRPAGGGFTLLELVIVAAISSVLFLVLIRWVLSLSATSANTLDSDAIQRSASVAQDAFAADVANAALCDLGAHSPILSIDPNTVSFFTQTKDPATGAAGPLQLTTWTIGTSNQAGRTQVGLTRSVVPADLNDPCNKTAIPAGTGASYGEFLTAVPADAIKLGLSGAAPGFDTLVGGASNPAAAQKWGGCTDASAESRCNAQQISIRWTFQSPSGATAPISVANSFPFTVTPGGIQ